MPRLVHYLFLLPAAFPAACLAQYEIGPLGGYGVGFGLSVARGSSSASTGFAPGGAAGILAGYNSRRFLGGETRYVVRFSDLKLSQGGTDVRLSALTHLIHYDLLIHAKPRGAAVRPFAAVGAGIKWFQGTGTEQTYQPLISFAALTKTREIKPLISAGGGVKFALSPRLSLRTEIRDYISPSPEKVIAAVPGAKMHGWAHDVVPMAGCVFTFGK